MGRPLSFLLDSVIVIDHLNGAVQATRFLEENHARVALSVITRAEVLAGLEEDDALLVAGFLDSFPTLSIDNAIADLAARLRRRWRWKLPDAFQAAIAQHEGLRLVTRNTKDFQPENHGFVVVPYQV